VLAVTVGCGNDEHVCAPSGPPTPESYVWPPGRDVVDCHGASSCDITCPSGQPCHRLDCFGAGQCRFDCLGTSDEYDCRTAGFCSAECFPGTTCTMQCDGADFCSIACSGGACLLDCGSATSCSFLRCSGDMIDCGGGILVCNRACP